MDSNQWEKIQDLFHQSKRLSVEEQNAFLKRAESENPFLAGEVKKLLDSHRSLGSFLEEGIFDEPFITGGDQIGPWKIIREIGRGGMSAVYLASRDDGLFERNVAIKFLHGLIHGRDMHRRLQTEQRILARLQHKNIAQLIDAGVTEESRPYFILEYIDGNPLLEWCNEQRLSFSERLKIFEQVCEAVQFAHQRLIVHRDLKPSNIFVNKQGSVKLLDFGIAKILEDSPQIDEPVTRTGLFLMTPEYASPEQINGGTITTATDVYALGLLLCELMTGSLPYDVSGKNPIEIGSVVSDTSPVKPSSIIGSKKSGHESRPVHQEGINNKQLKKRLKGDIDNIVLKALRKEPERRYGSADQLLQDILRYQNNLPVAARPENTAYLTGKFVRRHRTGVSGALIIALVLIFTAIYSIKQARTAETERQKAWQVVTFLQEMLASPNPYEDGRDVKVIDILDRTSARIELELDNQPAVEASVRHTLGITYRELGLIDEAKNQLAQALEIRDRLFSNPHPELSETQGELGRAEQRTGNYATADSLLNLAYESDLRQFGRDHVTVAARINDLGSLEWEKGNLDEAEQLLRESLALEQKLREPGHEKIAISLGNLATLLSSKGIQDEALQLYRQELEILRLNYEDEQHPSIAQSISHIGIILDDFEQFEDAREMHETALDLFKKIKGEEHADVVYAMNNLASVLTKMGEMDKAIEMQLNAADIYKSIFGPEHPNLGIQYNNIAFTYRNMGDTQEAEKGYRKAVEIWRAGLTPDHPFLGYGYTNLGTVLMMRDEPEEALNYFRHAYSIRTEQLDEHSPERALTASMLGNCLARLGEHEEAEPLLIEGYRSLLQTLGDDHSSTREAADRLLNYLRILNRQDDFERIAQGEI